MEKLYTVSKNKSVIDLDLKPDPARLQTCSCNHFMTHSPVKRMRWVELETKTKSNILLIWEPVRCVHGEGNRTPLQYSCLEKPMDGGAWRAAVNGIAEGRTRLSDFTFTFHFHALEKEMATHSSTLAWRIQGQGSLVGCRLWGHTESDMTEVT